MTVPNSVEESPAWLHYPGELFEHRYAEGIYVGYRYYDRRKLTPLFPFGFGLSYTNFRFSDLQLSSHRIAQDGTIEVSVSVTNCGSRSGKEVVQLYVSIASQELQREPLSLKAFAKVDLEVGETKRVSMRLAAEDLMAWHPKFKRWILESGEVTIYIGHSSRDLTLKTQVVVDGERIVSPLRADCSLSDLIQQPDAFARVVAAVSDATGVSNSTIHDQFVAMAPVVVNGLFITLAEFFDVDICREELLALLGGGID